MSATIVKVNKKDAVIILTAAGYGNAARKEQDGVWLLAKINGLPKQVEDEDLK